MSDDHSIAERLARLASLEDLFEHAPCGYVTLSSDGKVASANTTFCTWLECSAPAVVGRSFTDLLTVPGRVFYETHCRPLLRMQGFFHEVALDVRTPGGERLPTLVSASEKRTPDGTCELARLIITKAGDRRRYERGLVDAKKEAERDLTRERTDAELREQFIAVLGHDLRTPLAAIVGVAEVLQRETLSEAGTRFLPVLKRGALRMSALIDDILDFARGRLGGGIALNRKADVPVESTLRQVVDELRASHVDADIRLDLGAHDPIPLDHGRIAQLVANLVANAITHGAKHRQIVVRASGNEKGFELSVHNAGAPIPAPAMERIFQPFFREDVRRSQHGLGLGLYIVAEIAKAHGGTVDVASSSEETRFTVHIPR